MIKAGTGIREEIRRITLEGFEMIVDMALTGSDQASRRFADTLRGSSHYGQRQVAAVDVLPEWGRFCSDVLRQLFFCCAPSCDDADLEKARGIHKDILHRHQVYKDIKMVYEKWTAMKASPAH